MNWMLIKIKRRTMNNIFLSSIKGGLFAIVGVGILSSCCNNYTATADSVKYIPEFHEVINHKSVDMLKANDLQLFVDYSTCIAEGQNSPFYNSLVPSWVNASKGYYSIKGEQITKEEGNVYELLKNINEVNYANLKKAIEMMADGDSESALLTDGEYFQKNLAKGNINNPYMADAFKKWLLKGHDVYVLSEPYTERYKGKSFSKKRFYIIFTDNRLSGNVYSRIMQTVDLEDFEDVELFHLSADHPSLLSENGECSIVNKMLEAKVTPKGNYEIQDWQLTWKDGIEPLLVSAVDPNTSEPLPNGEVIANGIKVDRNSLGGFRITDIEAKVYNINDAYTAYYEAKESNIKPDLTSYTLMPSSNFIILDKEEFKKHGIVNLYFDTQMYNPDEFLTGSPYNYTKIDICVNEVAPMFDHFTEIFEFESIDMPGAKNVSISTSIQQCMTNPEIQTKVMQTPIYTIYIKSFER